MMVDRNDDSFWQTTVAPEATRSEVAEAVKAWEPLQGDWASLKIRPLDGRIPASTAVEWLIPVVQGLMKARIIPGWRCLLSAEVLQTGHRDNTDPGVEIILRDWRE